MHTPHTVIGAGPLGRATARALLQMGTAVRLVHRRGDAQLRGAEVLAADIADRDALRAAIAGSDVVYFCAQPAYHRWPTEFMPLLDRVMEACELEGAALVCASNLYMVGDGRPGEPIREDSPEDATSRKGRLRGRMDARVLAAHREGRVRAVIARGSDFFGPGVEGSVLGTRMFDALLQGKTVRAVGDIDQLHSYTYVEDFGRALAELGGAPTAWGRVWHVPNSPAVTTRAVFERAALIAGVPLRIGGMGKLAMQIIGTFVPPVRETIELLPHFTQPYVVDDRRWREHMNTCATPLDVALAHTLDACRLRLPHRASAAVPRV